MSRLIRVGGGVVALLEPGDLVAGRRDGRPVWGLCGLTAEFADSTRRVIVITGTGNWRRGGRGGSPLGMRWIMAVESGGELSRRRDRDRFAGGGTGLSRRAALDRRGELTDRIWRKLVAVLRPGVGWGAVARLARASAGGVVLDKCGELTDPIWRKLVVVLRPLRPWRGWPGPGYRRWRGRPKPWG